MSPKLHRSILWLYSIFAFPFVVQAVEIDPAPLAEPIVEPAWFKLSLLDLKGDIEDARHSGKHGLILYFGQKRCPYCKRFLEDNFSRKDVREFTRKHFDVISINVRGQRMLTDVQDRTTTERQFAIALKANLTPTVLFLDLNGKPVLRLTGYQAPEKFHHAMRYVVAKHYRHQTFRSYLAAIAQRKSLRPGALRHKTASGADTGSR